MRVTPPLVSIIVPAFGLAHLVGETIESIIAQTVTEWEAIVIDDGAPDDVAGAVQPYLSDPRIRFMSTDNGGLP
ncbi:MAG: glycosyltransferase family 2 protein, partial [Sphingomonas sp.]|nr:glycosyltransferase family 2 protein [Sphingomonas sp.]